MTPQADRELVGNDLTHWGTSGMPTPQGSECFMNFRPGPKERMTAEKDLDHNGQIHHGGDAFRNGRIKQDNGSSRHPMSHHVSAIRAGHERFWECAQARPVHLLGPFFAFFDTSSLKCCMESLAFWVGST